MRVFALILSALALRASALVQPASRVAVRSSTTCAHAAPGVLPTEASTRRDALRVTAFARKLNEARNRPRQRSLGHKDHRRERWMWRRLAERARAQHVRQRAQHVRHSPLPARTLQEEAGHDGGSGWDRESRDHPFFDED